MADIVCFGELMLRLSPPGYLRLIQTPNFEKSFGGAEANVAVSLANYGKHVAFVSKLPDNPLGMAAKNELRKFGVDTNHITIGGKRIGIYYLEKGASQRPSKVIYDRAGSSIAECRPEDFNWDNILEGGKWFHFTGITPALGDNVAIECMKALKIAKKKGLRTSCDLNFRKNLWTSEKAGKVMTELMEYVDLCIANEEDAEKVFGIKAKDSDVSGGMLSHEGYKNVAKELMTKFKFELVAITLRGSISASDNNWAGMLYDGGECYYSKNYSVHIVDRVGGGDSFGAGLIYSLLGGAAPKDALEFAVAASCLKHSIEGDFNLISADEVKTLMQGDGSGRVVR